MKSASERQEKIQTIRYYSRNLKEVNLRPYVTFVDTLKTNQIIAFPSGNTYTMHLSTLLMAQLHHRTNYNVLLNLTGMGPFVF